MSEQWKTGPIITDLVLALAANKKSYIQFNFKDNFGFKKTYIPFITEDQHNNA